MPSRSDSSRRSEMPSTFLSRTTLAIFSISVDLLTWYGISVTISASRSPRSVSSCILARMRTRPRPVLYASRTPPTPKMVPPVGKSGAGTWTISSSSVISGVSMVATMPSTSSPRLCGGMLVAMPTAMPLAPLSKRFGSAAGRTEGSSSEPSKLGV